MATTVVAWGIPTLRLTAPRTLRHGASTARGDAPATTAGASVSTTTGSKSKMVYEYLRSRILDGRYSPGFRLVLTAIAQETGVSVVPVREAVRRLESEGLVDYTHNVGAQVLGINYTEYQDTMTTLALLEGLATALSAPHLSPAELDHASELNAQMLRLTDVEFVSAEYRRLNTRFHAVLTSACPNERLLTLLGTEAERVAMIRRSALDFSPTASLVSVHQHEHLLDLIRRAASQNEIEHYARAHKLASMRSQLPKATAVAGGPLT